jgi:hypothetical protein
MASEDSLQHLVDVVESFLLIVRTRHIVTVPSISDGLVVRDTRSFQHIAEFYNYLG